MVHLRALNSAFLTELLHTQWYEKAPLSNWKTTSVLPLTRLHFTMQIYEIRDLHLRSCHFIQFLAVNIHGTKWKCIYRCSHLLVWAEDESIFFTVAGRGLSFGFVLKKELLVTQRWFCYCWAALAQSEGLLCCSPPCQWRGTRNWDGHSLDSWPKGYSRPSGVMLGTWSWRKKEGWGMFGMMSLPSQATVNHR